MTRTATLSAQCDATVKLLERISHLLPAVNDHIHRELALCDGYPGGSDAPKVRAASELTPVERVAEARLRLTRHRDQLTDDLATIASIAHNMITRAERTLGIRVPVPRCTGGFGREGHLEWGDPTCGNVPSNPESTVAGSARREMCDKHRIAEGRWRQANNLPPRNEEAA